MAKSQYRKNIGFVEDDHELISQMAKQISEKLGTEISLPKAVMIAVKQFDINKLGDK